MEKKSTFKEEVLSEFKTILKWVISGLIEAFFIVCWVLTQWVVNKYLILVFALSGIDGTLLAIFQWVFAVSTLAPIVFFHAELLVMMSVRTWKVIKKEFGR